MATITASLERSLRNCSLNHGNGVGEEDDDNKVPNGAVSNSSDISLPYHWEQQCLDLKTGEDSRTAAAADYDGDFSSEEGESWYDSEDYSSSESSASKDYINRRAVLEEENANVLVVAGCKSCYMYFMVLKKAEGCPRCNGHLLLFDRSPSSSPSSP